MDAELTVLILTAVIAVGTLFLVYFAWRAHRRPAISAELPKRASENGPTLDTPLPTTRPGVEGRDEIIYDGLLNVNSGSHEVIPLPVRAGQRIRGVLKETDGYTFNAYVMDSTSYARYAEGRQPRCLWAKRDVSSTTMDILAPDEKSYLLILDLYGKQIDRDISVRLRRTTQD